MTTRTDDRFRVTGIVEEAETDRPLPGLIVRAFDRDLVFDDVLGFAVTDDDGRFSIDYREDAFRDVSETRPDLYLRIFDGTGAYLVYDTRDDVRRNASHDEHFAIRISGRALERGSGA